MFVNVHRDSYADNDFSYIVVTTFNCFSYQFCRGLSTPWYLIYIRNSHRRCASKQVFLKIRNIRRKTPVLESFFNKVADIRPATLLKRDSYTGVFLLHLLHFEHLFLQDSSITFSSLIITTSGHLKSDSHLPKKVVLLSSLKALWNWWKMFFISSKKLFSFSRYLSFYHDFLVMLKKRLD